MLPALALGGMALGAATSGIGSILSGRSNKQAQRTLQRTGQQLQQTYQPYIDYGQQAMPTLQEQYSKLLNNPQDIWNQLGEGYEQSPGYKLMMEEGLNGINNARAAGGSLGTNAHQFDSAELLSGLAGKDYYNYMEHLLGLYGTGLEGTQNQFNVGANAAQSLGGNLAGLNNSKAQLQYTGGQNTGQALGGLGGSLMSAFNPTTMAILKALQSGGSLSGMSQSMGAPSTPMGGGSMGGGYRPEPMSRWMNSSNASGFGMGI